MAVAGGGLAGLAVALELAKQDHRVVLFEKEKYPYHKVCGEYLSLESRDYLRRLGLDLEAYRLPEIHTLLLTAPDGRSFTTRLPLGGLGISRYLLDSLLAEEARTAGADIREETRVTDIEKVEDGFRVRFQSRHASDTEVLASASCMATGKRSNLDVKRSRAFLSSRDTKLENYIGVKYHIKTDWPSHVIGLHNFRDGYCGISKIEEDRYCLCYMTTARQLKAAGNQIRQLEESVLYRNPHLKRIFEGSDFVSGFPVTISQISFSAKTQTEGSLLMLGDAAGMITPLCGNGMSIALHTASIASGLIHEFLKGRISAEELVLRYGKEWEKKFSRRLRTGRLLQRFFGSEKRSALFVQLFRMAPILARPVVKMTHGRPF